MALSTAASTAAVFSAARSAAYVDAGREVAGLMQVANPVPDVIAEDITRYREAGRSALDAGGPWAFWAEWYARAMAGDPLDWALQAKIALIPDEVWKEGVAAVADAIARIEVEFLVRLAVRRMIEEAEPFFDSELESRFGIGGNNPPEPIDIEPQAFEQVQAAWSALRALHNETLAFEANPQEIAEAIDALDKGSKNLEAKIYSRAEVIALAIVANAGYDLICWLLDPANIQRLKLLVQDWLKLLP